MVTVIPLPFMLLGRLWGWTAVTALLGIGLGFVPLFGVLGYELALAAALVGAIMGADLGRAVARELQAEPAAGITRAQWPGRVLARSAAGTALLTAGVIAIPAAIGAIRGLWTTTCDWSFGVWAFLVMPVATAALAGAVGHAVGVLVGPRRFVAALLAQLPALVVAGAALHRFYSAPPVFTYNAILGYFPGNLYDENVQLGAPLGWSRLEQLAWVIALVALVASRLDVPTFRLRLRAPRPAGRRVLPLVTAMLALAAALALRLAGGTLGYAIDAEDIQTALGGRFETPHFVIHYAQIKPIEEDLALVAADHEFRYAQVVAQTGIAPPGKIHSYLFADRDQKSALMGARDVEMAKPWRHEIYLEHRAFPHGSLRHEIAHVIASAFGDPIFGIAARRVAGLPLLANPGMIEGIAVALDWPAGYDRPNPHQSVRAMQEMGRLPAVSQLFWLSFFSVSSARGYTTAGSFLRFLLDTYGANKLRAVYHNGGDFDAAYGIPQARLEAAWRAMIATIVLPETAVAASAERVRGSSMFARPCPHAIAARREAAQTALGTGDHAGAVRLMREVCGDAPEEPRYRMELGDVLASGDVLDRGEAERLWLALATDDVRVTASLRAQAFERLARTLGARGELAAVAALVTAGAALPLEPGERRTLEGMALVLAHTGPAATLLQAYFFAPDDARTALEIAEAAAAAEPTLGFAHYLVGLQRGGRDEWPEAAAALERALTAGLPGPAFVKNAARRLAIAAYRTKDRTRLRAAAAVLAGPTMSTGDQMLAQDWLARAAFDDTGRVPAPTP